ncbi:ribonuclease HI, partial [Dysosmobacter welbionis]
PHVLDDLDSRLFRQVLRQAAHRPGGTVQDDLVPPPGPGDGLHLPPDWDHGISAALVGGRKHLAKSLFMNHVVLLLFRFCSGAGPRSVTSQSLAISVHRSPHSRAAAATARSRSTACTCTAGRSGCCTSNRRASLSLIPLPPARSAP